MGGCVSLMWQVRERESERRERGRERDRETERGRVNIESKIDLFI